MTVISTCKQYDSMCKKKYPSKKISEKKKVSSIKCTAPKYVTERKSVKLFIRLIDVFILSLQANQNIVANSMMPGVQLVNMRPNAPAAQTKTVATVSPRVVISNQHMVATRPTNPGVSANITR